MNALPDVPWWIPPLLIGVVFSAVSTVRDRRTRVLGVVSLAMVAAIIVAMIVVTEGA